MPCGTPHAECREGPQGSEDRVEAAQWGLRPRTQRDSALALVSRAGTATRWHPSGCEQHGLGFPENRHQDQTRPYVEGDPRKHSEGAEM